MTALLHEPLGYNRGRGSMPHANQDDAHHEGTSLEKIRTTAGGFFSRTLPRGRVPFQKSRLIDEYVVIGSALLSIEAMYPRTLMSSKVVHEEFRDAVASVRLEALTSYAEDLLTSGITDDALSIGRKNAATSSLLRLFSGGHDWRAALPRDVMIMIAFAAIGAFAVIGLPFSGIIASLLPALLMRPTIMLCIIIAVGLSMILFPYLSLGRRARFARIVAREISRRQGTDDERRGPYALVTDIFTPLRSDLLSPGV